MSIRQPITVIGSGQVAQVLARGFKKHGYPVRIGNRTPSKLDAFKTETGIDVLEPAEAIRSSEIVVLAVKGAAAESLVASLASRLVGKIVIDATNPIADAPPEDGILSYFTSSSESLMERLQSMASSTRFVKAFNSVGSAHMVDPSFPDGRPTMFIAGNDGDAKAAVGEILKEFGWDVEDLGKASAARPIESLCQLWCARGFNRGSWNHAFKLLRG